MRGFGYCKGNRETIRGTVSNERGSELRLRRLRQDSFALSPLLRASDGGFYCRECWAPNPICHSKMVPQPPASPICNWCRSAKPSRPLSPDLHSYRTPETATLPLEWRCDDCRGPLRFLSISLGLNFRLLEGLLQGL